MILAMDVQYADPGAVAAAVAFARWEDATASGEYATRVAEVAPYEPGGFYKRELPCLLALLAEHRLRPAVIVIDGYVTLGPEGRPGLGHHLHQALGGSIPVIGVAKTRFHGTPEPCELRRGGSRAPLYVSCAGMDLETAKAHVAAMHGPHRLPVLLARVDRLCRERLQG